MIKAEGSRKFFHRSLEHFLQPYRITPRCLKYVNVFLLIENVTNSRFVQSSTMPKHLKVARVATRCRSMGGFENYRPGPEFIRHF